MVEYPRIDGKIWLGTCARSGEERDRELLTQHDRQMDQEEDEVHQVSLPAPYRHGLSHSTYSSLAVLSSREMLAERWRYRVLSIVFFAGDWKVCW
jgi:hypothetical protein